jgi:hypothetical protein
MDLNEQQLLRTIVREEMKSALKEIGLNDDNAGNAVAPALPYNVWA